jgi:AcrR family transcriptional regulator
MITMDVPLRPADSGEPREPGRDRGDRPEAAHRRLGRPRSEQADHAIVEAALELFAEQGPAGLCIEKVAARAGVGKATIYRRWPGREDLLLAALAALKAPLPEPRGESAREDLIALVAAMSSDMADPRKVRQAALLHGEGQKYPRVMARFVQTVVEPRREVVRSVLRRGIATGEFRPDTDVEAALYMLTGAILTRGRSGEPPVEKDYPERVVDQLIRGLAAKPAR